VVFDMLNAVSVNTDDINIVAVRLCEICDLCLNNLPCEVFTRKKKKKKKRARLKPELKTYPSVQFHNR